MHGISAWDYDFHWTLSQEAGAPSCRGQSAHPYLPSLYILNPYLHSVEIDDTIQSPYIVGAKAHGQEQQAPFQKENTMEKA
jgi:hypothetical protein